MAQTIKGRTGEWEIVIGLEVHAQVTSAAKLFSGGSTTFGAAQTIMWHWSTVLCQACCQW